MGIAVSLPDQLRERHIGDAQTLGETFYTVPWAMRVTGDGHCYIDPLAAFTWQKMGTSNMRVRRGNTGDCEVDVRLGDHKWTPEPSLSPVGLIPVVKIEA